MDTSDIIAGLALLVSIVSMSWTWKLQRQQLLLNKHQLDKNREEEQAKKKAYIKSNYNSGRLELTNTGESVARKVRIEAEHLKKYVFANESLSIEMLHPNESRTIKIIVSKDTPDQFNGAIYWDDEFNVNRKRNFTLNL